MRLTGNTFWLEKADWDDFTRYEETVNNVIGQYQMLAICTYSLQKCNAAELLDVVANHQFALIKRSGQWETIESEQHKKIKQQLIQTEERYRKLFETMNEGFILAEVVADGKGKPFDCRFLDVNPAGERFFGRSREEIVGHTYKTIGGANADPGWIDVLCGVALTGEAVSLDRYAPVGGHWVHLLAYSPRSGQFAAIFDDITERKRAEIALQESNEELEVIAEELRQQNDELLEAQSALRESEKNYRTIVETSNEGIWVVDSETRTTYVNRRMSEMLGYGPGEILGKKSSEFMDEEGKARLGQLLERRSQGITESIEFKFLRKDGLPLWTISSASPLRDKGGKFVGSLGMLTDITERKRIEEALRESEQRYAPPWRASATRS